MAGEVVWTRKRTSRDLLVLVRRKLEVIGGSFVRSIDDHQGPKKLAKDMQQVLSKNSWLSGSNTKTSLVSFIVEIRPAMDGPIKSTEAHHRHITT